MDRGGISINGIDRYRKKNQGSIFDDTMYRSLSKFFDPIILAYRYIIDIWRYIVSKKIDSIDKFRHRLSIPKTSIHRKISSICDTSIKISIIFDGSIDIDVKTTISFGAKLRNEKCEGGQFYFFQKNPPPRHRTSSRWPFCTGAFVH